MEIEGEEKTGADRRYAGHVSMKSGRAAPPGISGMRCWGAPLLAGAGPSECGGTSRPSRRLFRTRRRDRTWIATFPGTGEAPAENSPLDRAVNSEKVAFNKKLKGETESHEPRPARSRAFLIIDDHPLFREALHSAVRMAYPEVDTVEAKSIAEALDVLSGPLPFDLALLDLSMPDVHGFEGLLQLRTRHPRLPVVVVSGHEEPKIVSEALSYGAAGFIPKSVRKDDLAAAIRSVMEGAVYVRRIMATGRPSPSADRADMARGWRS